MAENVNISSADLCHAIAAISSGARNFIAIDTPPSKSIAIACPRRVLMAGIEAKAAVRQRPEIRLDIEKAVVEFGTEAVLQYRGCCRPPTRQRSPRELHPQLCRTAPASAARVSGARRASLYRDGH
jgi:hypothetical protein